MANSVTMASVKLEDLTPAEKAWWETTVAEDLWPISSFAFYFEGTSLVISHDETFDLDGFTALCAGFFHTFPTDRVIALQWAETCSKPRPEAFGGGAMVITKEGATAKGTFDLMRELRGGVPPTPREVSVIQTGKRVDLDVTSGGVTVGISLTAHEAHLISLKLHQAAIQATTIEEKESNHG